MLQKGALMMFPTQWETGRLDSVLTDSLGNLIAYILELDDGKKVAVDMQAVELLEDD